MIAISERSAAAWTFATAIADQVLDAIGAKHVPTELEYRVADVGVADGADGEFLSNTR